jgi:hypothetical protein
MGTPQQDARAARLGYGGKQTAPKPESKPPPREQRMYPARRQYGGSIDLAVSSTFDRLEALRRDDPEKLAQLRADRRAVTRVLEERQVSFDDAHAMLSTCFEHLTGKQRSPEAIAQRWPAQWEVIRLGAGSTEAGEKVLENAKAFYKAVAEAAPTFAQSVATSGAAESAKMIQAAARYPNIPAPPPAAEA